MNESINHNKLSKKTKVPSANGGLGNTVLYSSGNSNTVTLLNEQRINLGAYNRSLFFNTALKIAL
jgi:hypothetical protein